MIKGVTMICDYTNWKGEKGSRMFVVLDVFVGKNEWHTELQELVAGFDIEKSELRFFALKDIENKVLIGHLEPQIGYATNWYTVSDDGNESFNHQTLGCHFGKKPIIINDQYGLQSRWQKLSWVKEYVYFYKGKRVGNRKVEY